MTTAGDEARRLLQELLGVESASIEVLLALAQDVLGAERAGRCIELVRAGRLTRRSYALAIVAALVAGTRTAGERWWSEPPRHRSPSRNSHGDAAAPDDLLFGRAPFEPSGHTTLLDVLWWRIAEDVANAAWGAPVDDVDLNSLAVDDRISLPSSARVGDRLVLSFDPGSRVDADVVERDGTLGSIVDLSSIRDAAPNDVWWSWATLASAGPHRLPDEAEEAPSDPYGAPIDAGAAAHLGAWAAKHGIVPSEVVPAWRTTGEVLAALARAGLERRPGEWHQWRLAMGALADRDGAALASSIAQLGRA